MLIERIALTNFKSYGEATVHLRPGTTAIIGENGAGKSTLLDAVGFVLFDHRPEGFTLSSLLREGASSGSAIVRFRCGADSRCYEVERAFTATTTTRYRVYASHDDGDGIGAVLAEGNEDVTAWLHRHLDVDEEMVLRDLFANTIGVPQGTLTAPFLLAAAGRKQVFEPLLRVHEYRRASDALRETSRELEMRSNTLAQEIANLDGQLAGRNALLDEREALSASLDRLAEELAANEVAWRAAAEQLRAVDDLAGRLHALQTKLADARSAAQVQAATVENARRALQEAQEARDRVEDARPGHLAYEQARRDLDALEVERATRDRLRDRLSGVRQRQAQVEARIEHLAQELERLRVAEARLAELEPKAVRHAELTAGRRALQEASARFESTSRQEKMLAERLAAVREALEKALAARQQAAALEAQQAEAQAQIEELRRREQALQVAQARDDGEEERLQTQCAALRASESSERAKCPVCESELTAEHCAELLTRAKEALDELGRRRQQQADELDAVAAERGEAEAELRRLGRALRQADAAADVARHEQERTRIEEDLAAVRQECAALRHAPEELEDCDAELASLADAVHEHRALQQRVQEGAETEARLAGARRELAALVEEEERVIADLAPLEDLDERIGAARAAANAHQAAHEAYLRYETVAQALPQREQALATAEDQQRTLDAITADLDRQHGQLAETYDAEEHEALRAEERRLSETLGRARTLQESQSARLNTVRQQLEALLVLETRREALQRDLTETQEMSRLLGAVRDLLRQAGPYVTRHLVQRISQEASTIYADIMEDPIGRLEWSEDYELSLEVQGHRRTFRQFSGGEQMIAAMALRLALLRVSSAIDVAFFDEPTAHLDAIRREGLADKITQVRGFAQIVVISHDDTFEQAAQSYLRVVKGRGGGADAGSRVEEL